MNVSHIEIVSIPVKNQDAAKDFYRDILGFQVIRNDPMEENRRWVQLGPEGSETSITLVTWFEAMPPGCLQGMVLATTDIERDQAELREWGLDISDIETAPWGRYATFADPDGNGWVLQQSSPDNKA